MNQSADQTPDTPPPAHQPGAVPFSLSLPTAPHQPAETVEDHGALYSMFGISLALAGIVMAPVPFVGPALAAGGFALSYAGRKSTFASSAYWGMWINGVGVVIGVGITIWFMWKYG